MGESDYPRGKFRAVVAPTWNRWPVCQGGGWEMSTAAIDRKTEALLRLREVAKERLSQLPEADRIAAEERHRARNRILYDFPDTGPLRRELYPRSMEFFAAGAEHDERAFIAANRLGKSRTAADEVAYHMTGMYPHWWVGRRFKKATTWWAVNESWKLVRDINQAELLGTPDRLDLIGTGAIPAHLIVGEPDKNPHIKFGYESFRARHVTGGVSSLQFKSYEQGRGEFVAVKITGGIWLDEGCPLDIYSECQIRVANTEGPEGSKKNGILFLTYTPMSGPTPLIMDIKRRAVNANEIGW